MGEWSETLNHKSETKAAASRGNAGELKEERPLDTVLFMLWVVEGFWRGGAGW